jgi:chromosome segregation ATPase
MLQDDSDPVWLQLLKRCAEDPECQLTILCSLAQLLAEQRAEHSAATGRQQQQIADLRQQLSAQQQEAAKQTAGLQEQVAGLQGQLQRLHVAVQQVLASHQH